MNSKLIILVIVLAAMTGAFWFYSGGSVPSSRVDYQTEINAMNVKFETAFNAGDAAGVDALYTADALLLPPGSARVSGSQARIDFWQTLMDSGVGGVDFANEEVVGAGDRATEMGQVTLYDGNSNAIGTAKYIVIWKKIGEDWKLHRDIWNLNP